MKITDFKKDKKFSMVTCYDATFAKVVEQSEVDTVLVGDSVAMVIYGEDSTMHATPEMIASHVKAVRKNYSGFLVADLPFLSLQKSQTDLILDVKGIINAGANALKIEGVTGNEEAIKRLVQAGVPIMGHVGLTPQFSNAFGGFKVQGRDEEKSRYILKEAKAFEDLGAFCVVAECIPKSLSTEMGQILKIPTIGIGAGDDLEGQVLVLQDLLGLTDQKFKFVKQYETGFLNSLTALNQFHKEVCEKTFPAEEHSFL